MPRRLKKGSLSGQGSSARKPARVKALPGIPAVAKPVDAKPAVPVTTAEGIVAIAAVAKPTVPVKTAEEMAVKTAVAITAVASFAIIGDSGITSAKIATR